MSEKEYIPEPITTCPTCHEPIGDYRYGDMALDHFRIQLLVWALIDEVEALRRGIGFTHVNEDPVKGLTDKYIGLPDRDFMYRTTAIIKRALKEKG